MNYYCSNCFSKSEYKFSKPKFCPECGAKTSTEISANKVSIISSPVEKEASQIKRPTIEKSSRNIKNTEAEQFENNEAGDEDEYYCSDLHSIISNIKPGKGVSVEGYKKSGGISFASLMEESSSSSSSSSDFKFQNDGIQKTKEQILEELRLEASSTRKHIEIE